MLGLVEAEGNVVRTSLDSRTEEVKSLTVPGDMAVAFEDERVQDEFGSAFHLTCCFM